MWRFCASVVPGYTDADIGKIRDSLSQADRIQLDLSIEALNMKGANVAVASGRRREALDKGGRTVYNEAPFLLHAREDGQGLAHPVDQVTAARQAERPAPGRLSASGAGRSR